MNNSDTPLAAGHDAPDAPGGRPAKPRRKARMLSRRGYFPIYRADLERIKVACSNVVAARSIWLALTDLQNQFKVKKEPLKVRITLIADIAGLRYRTTQKIIRELTEGGLLIVEHEVAPGKSRPNGPSIYTLCSSEGCAPHTDPGAHKMPTGYANEDSTQMPTGLNNSWGLKDPQEIEKNTTEVAFPFCAEEESTSPPRKRRALRTQSRGWL